MILCIIVNRVTVRSKTLQGAVELSKVQFPPSIVFISHQSKNIFEAAETLYRNNGTPSLILVMFVKLYCCYIHVHCCRYRTICVLIVKLPYGVSVTMQDTLQVPLEKVAS